MDAFGHKADKSKVNVGAMLTANNEEFYFDYQNGKYGFNTDPDRGAATFYPFGGKSEKQYAYIQGSDKTHARITLDHDTTEIYFHSSYAAPTIMGLNVNGVAKTLTQIIGVTTGSYSYGFWVYHVTGNFKKGDVIQLTTTQSANSMCCFAVA